MGDSMKKRTLRSLQKLAIKLRSLPDGKSKHFAFLLAGGKVVGFGYNQHRTNPKARWLPDRAPSIHAEQAAVLSTRKLGDTVVVLRLTHRGLGYSRPCDCCRNFLGHYGIKRVYYSTSSGEFVKEVLW